MPPIRRSGKTLGELVDGAPDYELVDESNRSLKRGHGGNVWLRHICGSTRNRFQISVSKFACGRGCPPCGRKMAAAARSTPKSEENSLFAYKMAYIMRFIRLVDSDDVLKTINRSSATKVWCACERDETHPDWKTTANNLSSGQGCPACARKNRVEAASKANSAPKSETQSLFAHKMEYHMRFVRLLESDDELKTITRGSSKKVRCACERNEFHPEWIVRADSLARGSGCPSCSDERRAEKSSIVNSTPKMFQDSLASLLENIASRKPIGSKFVRMANRDDSRTPEKLKKMSSEYATWICLCCGQEFTARISKVSGGSACRCCSRPGETEKIVFDFLCEFFGKVNVKDQQPLGAYADDARVHHPLGVYVDVETDGPQHYTRALWSTYKRTLEEQISRDVEKMRRASSEFVPTVRIPTVAVTRDAREDGDGWKVALISAIDTAAVAAVEAKVCGNMRAEDVMIIVEGHEKKYDAHGALLKAVLCGINSVSFGDLELVAESA